VTSDEAKRIKISTDQLGEKLHTRYYEHGYKTEKNECLINKCPISSLTFAPFNSYPFVINSSVLNEAVNQIKKDIRFIFLRQELGYAIIYRHVNQEMLGLVFDILNKELFHAKNERKIP
jgi:hypothetical protein